MSGRIVYVPGKSHKCYAPTPSYYGELVIGTIWKCECGKYYEWYDRIDDWGPSWHRPRYRARRMIKAGLYG